MQRCLLEILGIGGKDLPACYFLPENLDGAHVGELLPKALVVLFGGGEPDPVICSLVAFVAKNEDYLVLDVDRETAKHWARPRRQSSDRFEHEFMRDRLAPLDGEQGVDQRE